MTIKKPSFPAVTPQSLNRNIDKIIDNVSALKGADGSVDVSALKAAVGEDVVAKKNLETVLDAFEKYVPVGDGKPDASLNPTPVHSSCSGLTGYMTNPATLDQGQVSSVMNLLLKVKGQVDDADVNNDGKLSESEFKTARKKINLVDDLREEKLLRSAMHDAQPEVREFFSAEHTYESTKRRAALRPGIASQIADKAEHHAASPAGAEALKWAYNAMMVNRFADTSELPQRLDQRAQDGEQSWTRFLPFSSAKTAKGHLSNAEIQDMLGTTDLQAFTTEARAKVEDAVGDFQGWLNGSDIE